MKTKIVSAVAALSFAMTSFAAFTITADASSYVSYQKVTSTEDITSGDYLIVSETKSVAFDGSLNTLDAVSNTVDVTISSSSTIVSSENVDAAVFTVDTEAGTLRSASGSYIGVSSNSNGVKTSDDAAAYKNEFSIDDNGNAVIKASFNGSTMSLCFNAAKDQNRFRYYKNSSQNAIALYKKVTITPTDGDYMKVTAAKDITNGAYLLVYEANSVAFDGSLKTLDAAGNTVDVTISGDMIASSPAVDAAAFTIDTEAGTLRSASGSYIGVSSNSNGVKTSADAAAYKNEFSIDDSGNAVIKASFDGSTMSLRYNAGKDQNRFRYYKNSGQNAIALYKKTTTIPASATYIQVGDDFTSETADDNIASLWSITVTPGDSAITSLSVKAEDTEGKTHGTKDAYTTPAISGGSIVVGLVVNHAGEDVAGITTVINGDDVKAAADSRSLGLTRVNNARELGGYVGADGKKVKQGAFLRTAALGNASEADIAKLRDDYKLATVIDLRMDREIEADPDPVIDGVKNINLKIMDEKAMAAKMAALTPEDLEGIDPADPVGRLMLAIKAGIVGDQMYVNFLSEEQGQKGYTAMFDELLALPEGRSLLFHCTQGKDRTGCAAMLILSALGVDEDTILKDFMLTNTYNAKIVASQRQELIEAGYSGEELETIMSAKDQVNQKYMENAFEWMKENYGSAMGYITKVLGVSEDDISTLRAKFLV